VIGDAWISPVRCSRLASLAAFRRRGEGREQRGRDEPGGVVSCEAAGGGVFGCGVHEAEGGGDQPLPRQVGAERPGVLSSPDEGLHPVQDRVVDAADALGGQFPLRGQQDVPEPVDDLPGRGDEPQAVCGRVQDGGDVAARIGSLRPWGGAPGTGGRT
jgi:hypothetical protein